MRLPIEAIFKYISERDPQAAQTIKAFIKKRVSDLSHSPRRARFVKGLSVHALWLGRYPYIVYYRVDGDTVSIIHIVMAHGNLGQVEQTEPRPISPMVNRALT